MKQLFFGASVLILVEPSKSTYWQPPWKESASEMTEVSYKVTFRPPKSQTSIYPRSLTAHFHAVKEQDSFAVY